MKKTQYPSDLIDGEWKHVKGLIPKAKRGGYPQTTDMRQVLNAIFYLIRGGITWEMLPKDFPNWKTVYHYFRLWRQQGVWKAIPDKLRTKVRQQAGRNPLQVPPSLIVRALRGLKSAAATAGTTKAKMSQDASAICWLIRWDWCWPLSFRLPRFKIVQGRNWCFNRPQASRGLF